MKTVIRIGKYFEIPLWPLAAGIGAFIGDRKWYASSSKISFSNVQPGGYLAIFLRRDSTVSSQYSSPVFQPIDGGSYTYDVQLGRFY